MATEKELIQAHKKLTKEMATWIRANKKYTPAPVPGQTAEGIRAFAAKFPDKFKRRKDIAGALRSLQGFSLKKPPAKKTATQKLAGVFGGKVKEGKKAIVGKAIDLLQKAMVSGQGKEIKQKKQKPAEEKDGF